MEQRVVRQDIKKCQTIDYHPDFFLFSGDRFQSCSRQGGPLFTYPEVKYFLSAYAMLPNNKLLVHDARSTYHILDLQAGITLASKRMTRSCISTRRFAVSADGNTAYRIWLNGKKYYLVIINLSDLSYRTCPYKASWSRVADLICTAKDELLVLETQVTNDGVCHNQITSVLIRDAECVATPVYRWESNQIGKFFNGRYVWESGYLIRDVSTGECFSLLENSDVLLPEKHVALSCRYYPENNYLQLVDGKQNVFIDCAQRKIIARYQRDTRKPTYIGLCVDDEFWFSAPDGIYATPFPVIEDI